MFESVCSYAEQSPSEMINFSSTRSTSHKRCGANKKQEERDIQGTTIFIENLDSRLRSQDSLEQQVPGLQFLEPAEAHCEADVWPIEAAFQSCAQRLEGRLLVSGLNIEAVRISVLGGSAGRPSSDASLHGGAEHITSQQDEQGMICMRGPQ
jgi:hypothetical protein